MALKPSGRRTAPYIMPGRVMSEGNLCLPVTKSRPLALGTAVPAIFHWVAGVRCFRRVTVLTSFSPLVSSAVGDGSRSLGIDDLAVVAGEGGFVDVPALGSHLHEHFAGGGSHVAQLRTHGGGGAAAEGAHIPWNEVRVAHDHGDGVEGHAQFFGDRCASEVRMFWPTSTLPVKTLTWPSASIWIQALMSLGSSCSARGAPARPDSCASAEWGARQMSRPPPRSLRKSRRSRGAGSFAGWPWVERIEEGVFGFGKLASLGDVASWRVREFRDSSVTSHLRGGRRAARLMAARMRG